MMLLFVILLVLALCGGVYGHGAGWGPIGWSPVGIILIIVIILALTGRL